MNNTNNSRVSNLTMYLVSDVHLNNHKYDKNNWAENPERKIFREFLSNRISRIQSDEKFVLILNGDILDVTGSWFNFPVPWDEDTSMVEKLLHEIILEIIQNNLDIFFEFRQILKNSNAEIVYVIGNHDGLLEVYPSAQELIKNKLFEGLSLSEQERFYFATSFEYKELGLYVEHGHRLDPYNLYDSKQKPPLGDVVNILIVNKFIETVSLRLKEHGYSDEVINKIKDRLHDIEHIRPLVLIPLWIESVAKEHVNDSESKGKDIPVETILRNIIAEILLDKSMTQFIVKRLHIPMFLLHFATFLLIKFPAILPLISYVCTRLVRRTHSNKFQKKMALKLSREHDYKLICFGHTHIPSFEVLSPDVYYFNSASWTPVINLFKYSESETPQEEFLNLDKHFKKVERCGYLKITKDLVNPDTKAKFSLETIQIGEK